MKFIFVITVIKNGSIEAQCAMIDNQTPSVEMMRKHIGTGDLKGDTLQLTLDRMLGPSNKPYVSTLIGINTFLTVHAHVLSESNS